MGICQYVQYGNLVPPKIKVTDAKRVQCKYITNIVVYSNGDNSSLRPAV